MVPIRYLTEMKVKLINLTWGVAGRTHYHCRKKPVKAHLRLESHTEVRAFARDAKSAVTREKWIPEKKANSKMRGHHTQNNQA